MTPSEEDVTNFLAFAPEAGEGKAFLFLEVSHPESMGPSMPTLLTCLEGSEHSRRSCWSIL
jgi:hypothetical protein